MRGSLRFTAKYCTFFTFLAIFLKSLSGICDDENNLRGIRCSRTPYAEAMIVQETSVV